MQALKDSSPEYYVASIARLRYVFENARFNNFCGLPCARLSRSQSVRGEQRLGNTTLFTIVSVFFFNVPKDYLKLLDGIYMDNIVFQAPFSKFVIKVSGGWQQDIVNAAVLFAANIAFLAIPTLLPESGSINAAATASIVSIILSLSSVIFGQLLGKKLQALSEEHTTTIASYFLDWWSAKRGLWKLAVMYSLPYAMMIWGAIAFVLGVFLFTFKGVTALGTELIIITFFLSMAAAFCIWIVTQITGAKMVLVKLGVLKDGSGSDLSPNLIAPFRRASSMLSNINVQERVQGAKVKFTGVMRAVLFIGHLARREDNNDSADCEGHPATRSSGSLTGGNLRNV